MVPFLSLRIRKLLRHSPLGTLEWGVVRFQLHRPTRQRTFPASVLEASELLVATFEPVFHASALGAATEDPGTSPQICLLAKPLASLFLPPKYPQRDRLASANQETASFSDPD
jgi:hypothetical protein